MHMRTTVILQDELMKEAMEATGLKEKTAVIHLGLRELVRKRAAEDLKSLGGTMPNAKAGRRRRSVRIR